MYENRVDEVETDTAFSFGKGKAERSECSEFCPTIAIETIGFAE